jgi:hypothetical protein
MAYKPNIPLPGDFLSDSQGDIRNNFTTADNSFGRNHTNFSVTTDAGKHKFVEMVITDPVTTPPVPALAGGSGTIYTKRPAGPGTPTNIYYTPGATGDVFQLTNVTGGLNYPLFGKFVFNYNGVGVLYAGGWTFLPGGLILQYGVANVQPDGSVITFPLSFDVIPYTVQLTAQTTTNTNRFLYITNITTTDFTIRSRTAFDTAINSTFSWIAIGAKA